MNVMYTNVVYYNYREEKRYQIHCICT